MTTAAIIVAAGSGQRFGNTGKSFADVRGRPMAWWSLSAAEAATSIDEIVLVCGSHSLDAGRSLLAAEHWQKPIRLVLGGARRQDSTHAGITATSPSVDIVAIHDAARPLVTSELFDTVIEAARQYGAVITAVPVSDTIKHVRDRFVQQTVPRDQLVSVQTPQAFDKHLLLDAFTEAERTGSTVTDEASLIEQMGHSVFVVPGSASNIKVTWPDDLIIVNALMKRTLS